MSMAGKLSQLIQALKASKCEFNLKTLLNKSSLSLLNKQALTEKKRNFIRYKVLIFYFSIQYTYHKIETILQKIKINNKDKHKKCVFKIF